VNPTGKLITVIGGMLTGADRIDDLDAVRPAGWQAARRRLGRDDRRLVAAEFTHGHNAPGGLGAARTWSTWST
jgi:hypothetical protein